MNKISLTTVLCLIANFSFATGPGVKLGHDKVQRLTTGATDVHIQYAPKLHTEHGCKPFAAVDDNGNYNGGLKDSGRHNGSCGSTTTGQAYARSQCKGEFCGYMYVFYMPKDNGFPFASIGHRHDFEEVVVWTRNGQIIGAAYSEHGDYSYHTQPHMSGGRVNVAYDLNGFTHSMVKIKNSDRNKGTIWPVASWNQMTTKAKQALNDGSNFTNAVFAAKDSNFIDKLNEARLSTVTVTFN